MLSVGGRPKARQCLESRVPDTKLAPAREAYEDRIPISVSLGHVAPRRTGAQDPENAVDRSPLVRDSRTAFAPIGKQWIENAPFQVRQIARTQCCLLQKGSLKSKLNSSVKNCQHSLVGAQDEPEPIGPPSPTSGLTRSIEEPHGTHCNQFSTRRPSIRANSRSLPVTTVWPNASACAAMSKSFAPIDLPVRSRRALSSP